MNFVVHIIVSRGRIRKEDGRPSVWVASGFHLNFKTVGYSCYSQRLLKIRRNELFILDRCGSMSTLQKNLL